MTVRWKVLARTATAVAAAALVLLAASPARADWVPVIGDGYLAANAFGGRCMDVTNASTGNGALVQVWDCSGAWNQQWIFEPYGVISGHQSYRLHARHASGKCLDVTGGQH